jgi:hypothetical protein
MPSRKMTRVGKPIQRLFCLNWALVTALGLGLLLSQTSCGISEKPKIEGNKLKLPLHVYEVEVSDYPAVLYQFTGKYPAGWPAALTLPADSFIISRTSSNWAPPAKSGQGAILARSVTDASTYKIFGVCPGRRDEVFELFFRQTAKLGLAVELTPVLENERWSAKFTLGTDCTGSALASYKLINKQDKYLKGYVIFDLLIVLRAQPLAPEPQANAKPK